jgi:hypothetical protein
MGGSRAIGKPSGISPNKCLVTEIVGRIQPVAKRSFAVPRWEPPIDHYSDPFRVTGVAIAQPWEVTLRAGTSGLGFLTEVTP